MVENTVTEFEGEEVEIVVDADMAGGRLDATLARLHTVLSRNRIKDLILAGAASIDGRTVSEPKYRLTAGETITLLAPPPEDAEPLPQDIPLDILYEDDQLIVVNKPVGMVVHPARNEPREFLLVEPVAVQVKPVLFIQDEGPEITGFAHYRGLSQIIDPFFKVRTHEGFRRGIGVVFRNQWPSGLFRKKKAYIPLSDGFAHKSRGKPQIHLPARRQVFGKPHHEVRKMPVKRAEELFSGINIKVGDRTSHCSPARQRARASIQSVDGLSKYMPFSRPCNGSTPRRNT